MTLALVPADDPDVLFQELMEEIAWAIANDPRQVQTRIGPSGIGDPCDRALIAALMEIPEPDEGTNWRATVGKFIHAGLEDIFSKSISQFAQENPRYLLEQRVTVGRIGDWDLTGSCDLFDTATGTVWDWKTKSKTQHGLHKRRGMGTTYRVQFHSYGLGMANAGYDVKRVGGIFLLRDGDLEDSYPLTEPFDPRIALDALARANRLYALAKLVGADVAMSLFPKCTEEFCRRCGNYQPYTPEKHAPSTTVGGLIAAAL